jgi:hypothetical protein
MSVVVSIEVEIVVSGIDVKSEVVVVLMSVVVVVEVEVVVSRIGVGWTMGKGVEMSVFIWAVKLAGNDAVINVSFEVTFSFIDLVNDKASLYVIACKVVTFKPKLKLCWLFILFKSESKYLNSFFRDNIFCRTV